MMQGWAGIPVPGHSQEWMPLIPFPELWEWIFSFPSRSRILGMDFFHSLPVPEFWEWDFFIPFPFPKFGNGFFYSLPVPEFREWAFSIPFPFPNFGNGLFQFPSRSRTLKSHSRSPLQGMPAFTIRTASHVISWSKFSFRISTKLQLPNLDQTSGLKCWPILNYKI